MPPKAPRARPRPGPRRDVEATAPDPELGSASAATASSAVAVQTQAPIPPPAGRLDSLVSPSSSLVGADGGGNSRGVPVPLKFKPKNVPRKTKEEREALDAKFEATLAPIVRPRGGASTRGPRGRGGFAGRNERQFTAGASGPFALGSVTTRDPAQKIAVERGLNPSKSRHPPIATTKAAEPPVKQEEHLLPDAAEYPSSSSDSGSEGPRVDIEYISILDDAHSTSETETAPTWGAGTPIRVPRSAHVDRAANVNTDASTSRKGKLDRKGKGVLFEEVVKVKEEPADDDNGAFIQPDIPTSAADVGRRKKKEVPAKTRGRAGSGRSIPVLSSLEYREELEREELDRAATLRELTGTFAGVKADSDGDIGMDDDAPDPRNTETENQIFFFQFPNILPQLVPTSQGKQEGSDSPIKPEPSPEETPHHHLPPKTLQQRKLSTKAQIALLESYPPPGIAGKLQIHKSGRMTMLWGVPDIAGEDDSPFEMEVARGTQCEFLQELVVVKQHSPWGEQDVDERGRKKGVVFSLGQVKGKFVVSPDFGKLLVGEREKGKGKGKGKGKRGAREGGENMGVEGGL